MRADRRMARRLAALVAAPALLLAACGGDDDSASGLLTMATGSTGGTYFPLGGAMAQVWSNEIDGLRVSTQASGASTDNIELLSAGEVDLILSINGSAGRAVAGTGEFDGQDHDVMFLGNIYREVNQIVARADANIETVEDLDGRRVAIGPPGSGTAIFAEALLDRAGIDVDVFQDTFGEAADRLRDGSIDASFGILAFPAGSLEEVANSVDLTLVSLEGDLLQQTLADDGTLAEFEAPAGTYTGIDEPATLVSNWAALYATSDLDEDTAYDIVRVLYEQNEIIAEAHAVGGEIQIDTATDAIGDIPVHPGAERYYEEVGALE